MRILYIWHAAVEREYRRLLWKMADKGHEIHLVTAHRWTESSRDQHFTAVSEDRVLNLYPMKVIFRNHIRSFFYLNIFRIISLLRKIKPEVIYLKEEPYSIVAWQWVWLISWFSPKSAIVIESDENLESRHPFLYRWIERYVLSHIHGIASVPTAGFELYRRKGFQGKQFKTSYFVNEKLFYPEPREVAKKYFPEIEEEGLKLGFVGRITKEKGLDTLLQAISTLKKKGYSVKAYFLGLLSENYKNEFEDLIRKLDLENEIRILEARPMSQLVHFYNSIDLFVLPSRSTSWWIEQFGRVIVESHACGTPVIGSDSGEIPIVIGDESFVFPEGDIDRLATILEKFLKTEYSKEKMSKSLIRRVTDLFGISTVAEGKLRIMEEVMNGSYSQE